VTAIAKCRRNNYGLHKGGAEVVKKCGSIFGDSRRKMEIRKDCFTNK